LGLSVVVFAMGTVLMWALENGHQGGDIHGLGDAAFFTAVQLLTVSSPLPAASPPSSARGTRASCAENPRRSRRGFSVVQLPKTAATCRFRRWRR
jgi:hypothetical protein